MRLLFFGSPDFAVPSLRGLHAAGHEIARVVTQPDRPRGRSKTPRPTAVKQVAEELGLPVLQPARAGRPAVVRALAEEDADLGVVVAFGEILSPELLEVTRKGFVNLHASLLPDYRGAAPVNWAVMRGERKTGVSVIRVEPKLDAGPILGQRGTAIGDDETAGEVHDRLAVLGAELLVAVLGRMDAGERVTGCEQPREGGFFARKLTKRDGDLDWTRPAAEIVNMVRGLSPWPQAYSELHSDGRIIRVTFLETEVAEADGGVKARPGEVVRAEDDRLLVQTGDGLLAVRRLKPAGSREMKGRDFVHGYKAQPGDSFRRVHDDERRTTGGT